MYDIHIGQGYTKEQLESIFDTNFGARIKGITLRRSADDTPYALVFSRASGPYTDRIDGDSFYYDGEGTGKDQQLTPANKALAEANNTGRIIYGFRQEEAGGLWVYLGILEVLDYSYINKRGFMTYEFHFRAQPIAPTELVDAVTVIQDSALSEPQLTDDVKLTTVSIRARNAAFRTNVKRLYDNTCAVCRKKRVSAAGYPEVEAAHIYPKEKQGADDYRNGLALCRLHHWAFDSGLMAISDDLEIIVKTGLKKNKDYEEITQYEGKRITSPSDPSLNPALIYIRAHRVIHGF